MDDSRPCPKCGSLSTHVIGQSVSPPATFLRCADCGHSTTLPQPTPSRSAVTASDVEHLVETVVAELDLRFRVLSVVQIGEEWRVIVRTALRRTIRFQIRAGLLSSMRPAVRAALQERA
jgi:hypothetical protein